MAAPARRQQVGALPWDIWAYLGVLVLTLVFAVVRLVQPWEPERIVPLLGVVDRYTPAPKSLRLQTMRENAARRNERRQAGARAEAAGR